LLPWLLLLLAMVVAGSVLIAWMRRRLHPRRDEEAAGFSLQQLREMHAAGLLSEEEFRQARARTAERLSAEVHGSEKQPPSEKADGRSPMSGPGCSPPL
jgi:hypothetical protein